MISRIPKSLKSKNPHEFANSRCDAPLIIIDWIPCVDGSEETRSLSNNLSCLYQFLGCRALTAYQHLLLSQPRHLALLWPDDYEKESCWRFLSILHDFFTYMVHVAFKKFLQTFSYNQVIVNEMICFHSIKLTKNPENPEKLDIL